MVLAPVLNSTASAHNMVLNEKTAEGTFMAQREELALPFTWEVQDSGNIETFEQSFEEQVIS